MPKAPLYGEDAVLERQIVTTIQQSMSDGPGSYSDLQWVARNLIRMFKIERRPVAPEKLNYECHDCAATGIAEKGVGFVKDCPTCRGRRWVEQ
jgi:hypothetical protein